MGLESFIPEIWDANIQMLLEDNLVAKKICQNYTGKVKGKGQQVHFPGLGDATVKPYTGTVSYSTPADGSVSLIIDQDKYCADKIDDFDALMACVDVKGSLNENYAYKLAASADSYILKMYDQVPSDNICTADTTCDVTSILSDIDSLVVKLAENNVPEGRMWATITPAIKGKLRLAGVKFQINNGTHGKGTMAFSDELGIDLYVTNQVYKNNGIHYIMAGSYNAIVFAEGLNKSQSLILPDSFDEGIRSRLVYGGKVIRPKELAYIALTPVAEENI